MSSASDLQPQIGLYSLPHNQIEYERLNTQHAAYKLALNGLYPRIEAVQEVLRQDSGQIKRILDLGSGSGIWCCEIANEFPHAEVIGVDIAPHEVENIPSNCKFIKWDINDGLSQFYGQFNLVHWRFVEVGPKDVHASILESEKCLRPGGVIIWISPFELVTEDRMNMYPPYTSENPNGSWVQRFIMLLSVDLIHHQHRTGQIRADNTRGFWDHEACDRDTCGAAYMTMPMGPWATSLDPEENARLKKLGELCRDSFQALHHHLHDALLWKCGRSQKDVEILHRNVDDELQISQKRISLGARVLWGRNLGRTIQSDQSDPGHQDGGLQTHAPGQMAGYQIVSTYDDQDAWKKINDKILSTMTPEMISLETVPGFDMLEV